MKALVTGATGFAGSHLVELLEKSDDIEICGTTYSRHHDPRMTQVNLLEAEAVKDYLAVERPEVIYHLAAFASPALSFKHPVTAITDTLAMQINLYEACLALDLTPRILVVSSGQIYCKAEAGQLPLKETNSLDFASPYAVAKVGQEHLAWMYAKRGIESVVARPFNHIGPRQLPGYLVPDLCKQIAELESTSGEATLMVGNLTSKRDFTDVRDIVRAYVALAERGKPGEVYNVCSGKSRSGQEILDILLSFSAKPITTELDPSRMRPSDIPDLYGDTSKLTRDTGWERKIPLKKTLRDTLEFWRATV